MPKFTALAERRISGVDHQRIHFEYFGCGAGVNVFAVVEGMDENLVAGHVRQQAKLNLRVVGNDQIPARLRHESGADLAAFLRFDRDVLQIRIRRGKPPGGCAGLIECRVNAAGFGTDQLTEAHRYRCLLTW